MYIYICPSREFREDLSFASLAQKQSSLKPPARITEVHHQTKRRSGKFPSGTFPSKGTYKHMYFSTWWLMPKSLEVGHWLSKSSNLFAKKKIPMLQFSDMNFLHNVYLEP